MALLTTMMMIKAGADMFQGLSAIRGSEKQKKIQKEILDIRYKFNQEQMKKAFDLSYSNIMRSYADARQAQLEEATKGIKDTNIQISARAQNVNLTESSFKGDINAVMDYSLLENVNTMLQSQENDVNSLLNQKFATEFQAQQQYQDSLFNINNSAQQQKQVGFGQLLSGSLDLYTGFSQMKMDKESTKTGEVKKDLVLEGIKNFGGGTIG